VSWGIALFFLVLISIAALSTSSQHTPDGDLKSCGISHRKSCILCLVSYIEDFAASGSCHVLSSLGGGGPIYNKLTRPVETAPPIPKNRCRFDYLDGSFD
jgi:hypothetical protein